jgi:hypothetical protein
VTGMPGGLAGACATGAASWRRRIVRARRGIRRVEEGCGGGAKRPAAVGRIAARGACVERAIGQPAAATVDPRPPTVRLSVSDVLIEVVVGAGHLNPHQDVGRLAAPCDPCVHHVRDPVRHRVTGGILRSRESGICRVTHLRRSGWHMPLRHSPRSARPTEDHPRSPDHRPGDRIGHPSRPMQRSVPSGSYRGAIRPRLRATSSGGARWNTLSSPRLAPSVVG